MMLREKDKQTLLHIFSTIVLPVQIWAYGSRVNGTAHEGSNLDMVILSQDNTPLPYDTCYQLCEKIRDSNIPILVELRDLARLPNSFHKNILQHYEVVFDNRADFS